MSAQTASTSASKPIRSNRNGRVKGTRLTRGRDDFDRSGKRNLDGGVHLNPRLLELEACRYDFTGPPRMLAPEGGNEHQAYIEFC